jgi:uncharacterized protein YaiE (UPF0345 family)
MGRLNALTAFILLALAAPAGAAELTRVPSSGEPTNPFDLDLSVSWVRSQRSGSISREYAEATGGGQAFPAVRDLRQLRYSETTNSIVTRAAVGLWEDLGLSFELPYVLGRDSSWRRGPGVGTVASLPDTIATNALRPDGTACGAACPIFDTTTATTVYHGGVMGDLKVGLDWGILSDRRDDTKPFWLVGVEVTFPTGKLYDPGADRSLPAWLLPNGYYTTSSKAAVGEKVFRYDFHTALSRRIGKVDPYFRANFTMLAKSSSTPSNCDHAAAMVAAGQAAASMDTLCQADPSKGNAILPWQAGLTFGVELVPYEDRVAGSKVAFDLRLSVQRTSSARWYNELSDATGKLMATEGYYTGTARAGAVFRASEHLAVVAAAAYGYSTPHALSGESQGGAGTTVTNPNFDWRFDAPGRRFHVAEATTFDIVVSGIVQF